ncbi:MAG: sugar ABC transporter permease [Spirochaetaceae bacterium]|jgi:sn-glycerol 3-phosphate transport system permease protein|nr:sugar ABC transporter permease [Spirochaetaceae bacterium]
MTKNEGFRYSFKAYLFLLPALFIFTVFVFMPFAKTVFLSFTLTNSRGGMVEFVGLENYLKLFKNAIFLNSLKLTLIFAPLVGIPTFLAAYFLAALANVRIRGSRVYEVMYSLPMAVASAPAAAIWFMLLSSSKSGIVNHILGTDIRWLLDARFALFGVAFVTIWLNMGTSFIFLLTGFRNVPDELIESSRIDGAGYFKRLFNVITPVASPQIFFVIFLNIITSFQAFAQIRLLTQGGPSYSTNVLVYTIYQAAIRDSRFETAFAQSMVLFVIILVITIIQFKTEDKMVHYQ